MKPAILSIAIFCTLFSACKKEEDKDSSTPTSANTLTASITVINPLKTVPDTVTFVGNCSQPYIYCWNYGDGTQLEYGTQVTHIFIDPDYYKVKLSMINNGVDVKQVYTYVNTLPVSRVHIDNLKFLTIPTTKPDGTSWDANNGAPDPYYKITYHGVTHTSTIGNNSYSLISGCTPTCTITKFEDIFHVEILDSDPGSTHDDLIDSGDCSFLNIVTNNTFPFGSNWYMSFNYMGGETHVTWLQ